MIMAPRRLSFRAFISFALLVGGLVAATAGIVLFLAPSGRVANLTDWHLLGLSRPDWQAIRTIFALVFLLGAAIHVYLNWRPLRSYLWDRSPSESSRPWEMVASVALLALVFVFTLRGAAPFSSIVAFGERVSASWPGPDQPSQASLPLESAPDSRAGTDSPPEAFPVTRTESVLTEDRVPGTGTGTGGGTGDGARPGAGSGEGLGRLTLEEFCRQEGIVLSEAANRLAAAGIRAEGGDRLRTLAADAGLQPNEVADLARGRG
jgi:hypothetical protein